MWLWNDYMENPFARLDLFSSRQKGKESEKEKKKKEKKRAKQIDETNI